MGRGVGVAALKVTWDVVYLAGRGVEVPCSGTGDICFHSWAGGARYQKLQKTIWEHFSFFDQTRPLCSSK
jgi:hypothetical protein